MDAQRTEALLAALAEVRALPVDDPRRERVRRAVDGLVRDGQRQRRAQRRRRTAEADRAVAAATATGSGDRPEGVPAEPGPTVGSAGTTRRDRRCYTCRDTYREVDAFYHRLCPACADAHRRHRAARTDLAGRRAVVTGGRVKIGYQVALRLLRDGACVTVVTRFPADAVRRYLAEPDADRWRGRLCVLGADLRDPRQVLDLAERIAAGGRLDILVNNAAQTVRRPEWAYRPLVAAELAAAPAGVAIGAVAGYRPGATPAWGRAVAAATGAPPRGLPGVASPPEPTDATGALVVPGTANSWTARLGEVDPVELLEVQLVNVVAPFLLLDRLRPALAAPGTGRRYVVNVTGREGWFGADGPGPERHPHTSVSKAALNMLTRVGAPDLARQDIHMCAVDTGWITDENPPDLRTSRTAAGWRPPLDVVDAAARIHHPIVSGEAGRPVSGVLLRHYTVVPW